jgi:hypothetical protein
MAITTVVVVAFSGARLVLDNYCTGCARLLSFGEMQAQTCWWCEPETRPDPDTSLRRAMRYESLYLGSSPVQVAP